MASCNENEDQREEYVPAPHTTQPKQEHSEASQVLETMRTLIIQIQSFKVENEQLKKDQEKQHEINDMLLQILHERNNEKE